MSGRSEIEEEGAIPPAEGAAGGGGGEESDVGDWNFSDVDDEDRHDQAESGAGAAASGAAASSGSRVRISECIRTGRDSTAEYRLREDLQNWAFTKKSEKSLSVLFYPLACLVVNLLIMSMDDISNHVSIAVAVGIATAFYDMMNDLEEGKIAPGAGCGNYFDFDEFLKTKGYASSDCVIKMNDVWYRLGNAIFFPTECPVEIFGIPFDTWFVWEVRIHNLVKFHSSDCEYARMFPVLRGIKKMVVECGQALIGIFADVYILEQGWCDRTKDTAYVLFCICNMLKQVRLLVEHFSDYYPALNKIAFVPLSLIRMFGILVKKERFRYIQDGGFAVSVYDFLRLFKDNVDLVLESTEFDPVRLEPCISEYKQFVKTLIADVNAGTRVFRADEMDRDVVTADTFKLPDAAKSRKSPAATRSRASGSGKGRKKKASLYDGGGEEEDNEEELSQPTGRVKKTAGAKASDTESESESVSSQASGRGRGRPPATRLLLPPGKGKGLLRSDADFSKQGVSVSFAGVRKPAPDAPGIDTESGSDSGSSQASGRGRGRPRKNTGPRLLRLSPIPGTPNPEPRSEAARSRRVKPVGSDEDEAGVAGKTVRKNPRRTGS